MEMKAISFPPPLSDAQEIERAASTWQCLPQRYYRASGRYHSVLQHCDTVHENRWEESRLRRAGECLYTMILIHPYVIFYKFLFFSVVKCL